MYIIADNSHTVGNAITVISDVTIPVPIDFRIEKSIGEEAILLNEKNNESITILCLELNDNSKKEFKNMADSLKEVKTKTKKNNTFEVIEFEDSDTGKSGSLVYFEKEKHSFIMKLENYEDNAEKEKDMMYIIDNLIHDFKKNK